MKLDKMKEKKIEELEDLLIDEKNKLAKLYLKHEKNELGDYSQIKKQKRDVARLLTVLNKKRSGT